MVAHQFQPVELPSRYAKAIVATLTAVVAVLAAALTDGAVDTVELAHVGLALITALGVYWVPNAPEGLRHYAKAVVAIAGTALQALVPFLIEGSVTPAQWLMVLLAGLGAIAVGIVPNTEAVRSHYVSRVPVEVDDTPPPAGYRPRHLGDPGAD